MCIVGGLRTFPMPVIQLGVRHLAHIWNADILFDVTTTLDVSAHRWHTQGLAPSSERCPVSTQIAHSILKSFHPVNIRINEPVGCETKGSRQFEMIARCFADALRRNVYTHFSRIRPDFVVPLYYDPLWSISRFNQMCTIDGTNTDIAFILRSCKFL